MAAEPTDSVKEEKRTSKFVAGFRRLVKQFTETDTTYIEPQRYNFTVMLCSPSLVASLIGS